MLPLFILWLQTVALTDPCAPVNAVATTGVVVPVIEGVAAATITGYLVGFFKKAYPLALDRSIVAVAVGAGLLSACVAAAVNGDIHLTQISLGTILFQGIGAAALSTGVHEVNKPADPLEALVTK